jgi:hyaluronate lyase
MHFTGMGGYIFLGDNTVRYDKTTYNGSASNGTLADETRKDPKEKHTFLEITIDHGKNPSGGKYAYIYLPEATLDKTNAYSANPDVKVLSDSNTVHAALETKIGALGAVFYAAGTLTVNESSSPVTRIYASNGACVIVSTNENGETVISVSDPTNSLSSLSFEIDVKNAKSIKSFDDGVSGATITSAGKLSFRVNTTDDCGKTFSVTVA